MHKKKALDIIESQKAAERERALQLTNMPNFETIKRDRDQEIRRNAVERNLENYVKVVAWKNEEKIKKSHELLNKYMKERAVRLDLAEMRKSAQAEMYKTSIMSALDEQKIAKDKERAAAKKHQEELERAQMEFTIAKDEEWQQREQKKQKERRQHAQNLIKESDEKYQRTQESQ